MDVVAYRRDRGDPCTFWNRPQKMDRDVGVFMGIHTKRKGKVVLFFVGTQEGIKSFGEGIQSVVNTILLSAVYLVGVGIAWLMCKVSKRTFFAEKPRPEATSYWEPLDLKKRPIEEYRRQF